MKTPKTVKFACRILRRRVRYEDATLVLPGHSTSDASADTDAIRRATKLYVESWIIPLIDAIESGDIEKLKTLI